MFFCVKTPLIEYTLLEGICLTNILGSLKLVDLLGSAKLFPYFMYSPFHVSKYLDTLFPST